MNAQSDNVLHIPSMESSMLGNKKHEDNCGLQVPALKRVGDACVNHRSDIKLYVYMEMEWMVVM
jgi:hypothetical protein